MNNSITCKECGKPISDNNTTGVCPSCLLGEETISSEEKTRISNSDAPNQILRNYKIVQTIARGGMGVVYLAEQIDLKRPVALKMILKGEDASPDELKRFQNEAQSVASLNHPNIVEVYETGEESGYHFFSMEYVDGGDLGSKYADNPLSDSKALELMIEMAEAIACAHQNGVIHRDLKPHNILLSSENQKPKVADFGISKNQELQSLITEEGAVLGSPSYMSPEQASGNKEKIGEPSDVYSLGAILYFLLTGRPPFKAATPAETMRQVIYSDPAAPMSVNPDIRPDANTICLKALEKNPSHRYSSAQELADDCRRLLEGKSILARPASQTEKVSKWMRRNPVLAGLTLGIIGITVISFALILNQLDKTKSALAESHRLRISEMTANSPKVNPRYFVNLTNKVSTAVFVGDNNKFVTGDDGGHLMLWSPEDLQNPEEINSHEGVLAKIQYSPLDKRIYSWSYDTRTRKPKLDPQGKPQFISSSHRFGDRSAQIWSSDISHQFGKIGLKSQMTSMAVSRDGKMIATGDWNGKIRLYNSGDYSLIREIPCYGSAIQHVAFSPDGTKILASNEGNRYSIKFTKHSRGGSTSSVNEKYIARVFSTKDFSLQFELKNLAMPSSAIVAFLGNTGGQSSQSIAAWSPDGKWIATGGESKKNLAIWNARNGKLVHKLDSGHSHSIYDLAFSPDSQLLVSGAADNQAIVWDVLKGRSLSRLQGHSDIISDVEFSPDGKWVATASADTDVRVWDPTSGAGILVLEGHRDRVNSISYSQNGLKIISTSDDASVCVFDAAPLHLITKKFHTENSISLGIQFSDDGKYILSKGRRGELMKFDIESNDSHNYLIGLEELKSEELRRSTLDDITVAKLNPNGHMGLILSSDSDVTLIKKNWLLGKPKTIKPDYAPLKLYDFQRNQVIHSFPKNSEPISAATWSKDNKWIAAGGAYKKETTEYTRLLIRNGQRGKSTKLNGPMKITIWDSESGDEKYSFPAHEDSIIGLYFTQNKKHLVSSSLSQSKIWNLSQKPKAVKVNGIAKIDHLEFTQDENQFLAYGSNVAGIFDMTSGAKKTTINIHGKMGGIHFATMHENSNRVLSLDLSHLVYIHNLETGDVIDTIDIARGRNKVARFSPDGKYIVFGGNDRIIYVCNAEDGSLVKKLEGHQGPINILQFSPDGQWLASGSDDQTIRLCPVNAI